MWLGGILLFTTTLAPALSSDSFATLASRAMCMAGGCKQESCMKACSPSKLQYINDQEIITLAQGSHGPERMELVCREANRLAVKWCDVPDLIYLTEYSIVANDSWTRNITSNCSFILTKLKPNSTYRIKLRGIEKSGQVGQTITRELTTATDGLRRLAGVNNVTVEDMWASDHLTATARLSWTSPDFPCQYSLVLWKEAISFHPERLQTNYPDTLNEIELSGLEHGARYKFGVSVATGSPRYAESETKWTNFTVPSCLEFYPGNLTICSPLTPNVLVTQQQLTDSGECELHLKWATPAATPAHYELSVKSCSLGHNSLPIHQKLTFNISGYLTEAVVGKLEKGADCLLTLSAVSKGGSSEPLMILETNICNQSQHGLPLNDSLKEGFVSIWFAAVLAVSSLVLISLTCLLWFFFKQKTKEKRKKSDNFKYVTKYPCTSEGVSSTKSIPVDEYEIQREVLSVCNVIGEGAFGVVHKGILMKSPGNPEEVAVKMLRDHASVEEVREFQKEISLMKTVGKHKYIVSLIGCCTQTCRLMLIVEFCALGDLQNYLRQEWKKQTEALSNIGLVGVNSSSEGIHSSCSDGSYENMFVKGTNIPSQLVTNAMYDFNINSKENNRKVFSERLLSFALQIALGMEYLARNRVVHRDLAARNILVCSDESIKISDFGLSRDIYEQNIYCMKSSEKLPVKWMALESLLHQIFTTQSDVWSFGVLLWEIVTLGGNPYPSTPTNKLFRLLKQGFRMEQPPTCSNQLYAMMMDCWKESPKERPSFSMLVKRLTEILESASAHQYLDLSHVTSWGTAREDETVT